MGTVVSFTDHADVPFSVDDFLANQDGNDASDLESDNGEEKTTKRKGDRKADLEGQAFDQIESIFDDSEDGDMVLQYTLTDFREMVVRGGYSGQVVDEEREMFRRMIRGYEATSVDNIVSGSRSFVLGGG